MTDIQTPLDSIAQQIRDAWSTTRTQQIGAWDGYFLVGALLRAARNEFTSDQLFGRWFAEQNFGFNRQWAYRLRTIADRETDVRDLLTTAVVSGDVPGVNEIIRQLNAPPPPIPTDEDTEAEETGTVVLATTPQYQRAAELLTELARINYARDILPTTSQANLERLQALATRADRVIHRMLVEVITVTEE